eukprot:g6055.t1
MASRREDAAPGVDQLRQEVESLRQDVDTIRSSMQEMHREVGSAVLLLSRFVGLQWNTDEALRLAEEKTASARQAVDRLSDNVGTLERRLTVAEEPAVEEGAKGGPAGCGGGATSAPTHRSPEGAGNVAREAKSQERGGGGGDRASPDDADDRVVVASSPSLSPSKSLHAAAGMASVSVQAGAGAKRTSRSSSRSCSSSSDREIQSSDKNLQQASLAESNRNQRLSESSQNRANEERGDEVASRSAPGFRDGVRVGEGGESEDSSASSSPGPRRRDGGPNQEIKSNDEHGLSRRRTISGGGGDGADRQKDGQPRRSVVGHPIDRSLPGPATQEGISSSTSSRGKGEEQLLQGPSTTQLSPLRRPRVSAVAGDTVGANTNRAPHESALGAAAETTLSAEDGEERAVREELKGAKTSPTAPEKSEMNDAAAAAGTSASEVGSSVVEERVMQAEDDHNSWHARRVGEDEEGATKPTDDVDEVPAARSSIKLDPLEPRSTGGGASESAARVSDTATSTRRTDGSRSRDARGTKPYASKGIEDGEGADRPVSSGRLSAGQEAGSTATTSRSAEMREVARVMLEASDKRGDIEGGSHGERSFSDDSSHTSSGSSWTSRTGDSRSSSGQSTAASTRGDTPCGDDRSASSPLRSYAKGKNSLWLLNSDTYSSVTMKMLIEKQAAAAARLNSPSRLEALAADSPPRRRRRPGTPTKESDGADRGGSSRQGGRDAISSPPSPRRTASAGGIALSELVSATTPPRSRSSALKVDVGGGAGERRSLAQETYTKTFTGMQAYGESGMTVLEELIDAAFRACDVGHAQGQQRVTGAALLTRSGKIFAGCNVESTSVDLSVGAERTTVLKAVSEGETRFRSMAMASDTELGFPSPDGPGRQFLAEFGEFPVYLVNRDMQARQGRGLGPGGARDEAIVAASREREKRPPRDWGVQELLQYRDEKGDQLDQCFAQVLDWLEDELELGEYRREFARAKVDGALLLNLVDKDLQDMLGMTHPLHRRRVCLGIQKIKDKEEEEMGKNYADMDDYVRRLDRDRIRLITKLKVVFDRFDKNGTGSLSAADARDALEYMGRDVTGEACASWLADKERKRGDIPFVDFTTAYSALFVDEDPDVDLGEGGRGPAVGGKERGVSVTGSGHVRLRQKEATQHRGGRRRGDGGGELWASGSSEEEGGLPAGGSGQSTPRKTPRGRAGKGGAWTPRGGDDGDPDLDDGQIEAFEALRSVKKLAEVKRVFDRFAVDGMLTAYEALQALTEAGCTAPRTHAGRYLRSRRFFGLRREVTFFEFLRSMAALGVHDSGAHVAGFAPSRTQLSGGARSSVPLSARSGSRRRGHYDAYDDEGLGGAHRGRRSNSSGTGRRRRRRPRNSREETDYDVDDGSDDGSFDDEEEDSTSADDAYRGGYRRRSPPPGQGLSARHGGGGASERRGGGSTSPKRRSAAGCTSGMSPRRSPARDGGSRSRRGGRDAGSGDSSSGLTESIDNSSTKRRRQSRSGDPKKRGSTRSPRGRARGGRETSDESAPAEDSGGSEESAFGCRSRSRSRQGRDSTRDFRGGVGNERERRSRTCRGHRETDEDDDSDLHGRRQPRGGRREEGESDTMDRGRGRGRDRDRDFDGHRRRGRTGDSRHDHERPVDRERERGGGSGSGGERGDGGSTSACARLKAQSPRTGGSSEGHREGGGGAASSFCRGDRVEARYRGRGNKFYKGNISRVNSDDTLDIAYDDGEKEIGIAAEHVNSLEPSARSGGGGGRREEKFSRGDRVEARYRGKGSKFYKGKISRVNSDDTLDIAYDDGDKEIGISPEHVNSLEPRASSSGSGNARRSDIAKGDRVEARYRGKGTKFYKGKISRVNSDGTFDIAYDDGEKEIGIASEHVNSLEPTGRSGDGGSSRGSKMAKGDRVEARYRGKGTKFYKGKISRVNSDGTLDIAYDDGDKEIGIALEHVNWLEAPARGSDGGGARRSKMAKGDRVEARYRGKGTKFYKGKVSRVNSDDTLDIAYDDGDKEIGISPEHVNSLEPRASGSNGGAAMGDGMAKGDRVEARYRGKGTKFYKGKISRVNSDGTLDIAYDDGEREIGIALEHVNSLEPTARGDGSSRGSKMAKGDKVEARYRGKGTKFYKGKISRVNSDGTLDIAYDDGEKEIGIAVEHVNSLEPPTHGGGGGGGARRNKMGKGDRVEARYRGKGTKFYKGKISRVNSDDTFDISYDDGDKETGIAKEHVRLLDLNTSADSDGGRRAPVEFREGDKVEGNYRGRGRYYPGRITRVHRDGTYDIDYDDGERERMVEPSLVQAPQSKAERAGSDRLEEGTKVEARYKGRSRYYPGRITRVHHDGTFDIDYDDGERERMVEPSLVKALKSEKTERRLEEGMKVEARYKGRSRYYPGRISRVHRDGTCDIDYDDGERERGVSEDLIRARDGSSRNEKGDSRRRPDFQRGDRVEARYRGKGTKFYKGKISRVNSDATLDIAYDDGEKEIGIAVEHVNALESTVRGNTESKMIRGDRVEVRYRGKGTKFYKGKISRVNSDDTFDIAYDDGEEEIGIAAEHVRSLESQSRSSAADRGKERPAALLEGDKVEANYRGRGRYYKGRIGRVNLDGTFNIDYDDGQEERGVTDDLIRALPGNGGGDGSAVGSPSRLKAVASRVTARGTTDDDDRVPYRRDRHGGQPSPSRGGGREGGGGEGRSRLQKGDRVEARYRGKGTTFYKGMISRVNSDDTFDIAYDDGEKEVGISEEHVRSLESGASTPARRAVTGGDDADDADASTLLEGNRVEGNFQGRGRFYKGRVSRLNLDGTINIDYDDGEKERGVKREMVRPLDGNPSGIASRRRGSRHDSPSGGRGGDSRRRKPLQRGDRVEVRYRGKGTKFYKGRVSRVNPDATLDIAYDDGDTEIGIDEHHVREVA